MSIQGSLNQMLGSVASAVHAKVTASKTKAREEAALQRQQERAQALREQKKGMKDRRQTVKHRTGSKAWIKEQPSSLGDQLGNILGPEALKQVQQKYKEQMKREKEAKKIGQSKAN